MAVPRSAQTISWRSRWVAALASRAIGALASFTRRICGPTLLGVPVSAAILTPVITVRLEQPLEDAAHLFVSAQCDLLPVIEYGRAVSVISRGDVAAALERVGPHAPVAAAPSRHVVAVTPSDSLAHVLERLTEMPDAVAVVIDHGGPVGVLTADTVAVYLDQVARAAA